MDTKTVATSYSTSFTATRHWQPPRASPASPLCPQLCCADNAEREPERDNNLNAGPWSRARKLWEPNWAVY